MARPTRGTRAEWRDGCRRRLHRVWRLSNNYWARVISVPHPGATQETDRRVAALLASLFVSLDAGDTTVADLARHAGLAHETVRRLWRNPGGRLRYGPGFFIVAALAEAQAMSLDELARQVQVADG